MIEICGLKQRKLTGMCSVLWMFCPPGLCTGHVTENYELKSSLQLLLEALVAIETICVLSALLGLYMPIGFTNFTTFFFLFKDVKTTFIGEFMSGCIADSKYVI